MFVVALLTLATAPDDEAAALAVDLGVTGYEAGQLVRGHLPSIVLKTADAASAYTLVARMTARGHRVASCDAAGVPGGDALPELRDFRLEGDALLNLAPSTQSTRLPWATVTAIVRATHRLQETAVETSRERKFDLGRAILTQGLSISKTVKTQTVTEAARREPVVYLFHTGGPPWRASESRCRYEGLGPQLRPGRLENFNTLLRLLREHAPTAAFDERLVSMRAGGEAVHGDLLGAARTSSNASTVELLAHLVAGALRGP